MSALETTTGAPPPSLPNLFTGFLKIGLMGFGGVGPVARHIIVAERNWLDDRGYAELIGICQALPGANTVNAAVMLGDRFRGGIGARLGHRRVGHFRVGRGRLGGRHRLCLGGFSLEIIVDRANLRRAGAVGSRHTHATIL